MALTITEAQAVNDLLKSLQARTDDDQRHRGLVAAELLADRASRVPGAGLDDTSAHRIVARTHRDIGVRKR